MEQLRNGPELEKPWLNFELVSRYFSLPIEQAARELKVGQTFLKKRCRELGIPRWPGREVRSLQKLIDCVKELGKDDDRPQAAKTTEMLVQKLQQRKKLMEESPHIKLDEETNVFRLACYREKKQRRQRKMELDQRYSAKSAYEAQFFGRIVLPDLQLIWKAKAKDKVRFFMWLLLQNRLWTADRLRDRGWDHDDHCCLCGQVIETAVHLMLLCPFAKLVWAEFQLSDPSLTQKAANATNLMTWWREIMEHHQPDAKKQVTTALYILWNLWNERNRRTFQGIELQATAVAQRAKEDVHMFRLAHRIWPL